MALPELARRMRPPFHDADLGLWVCAHPDTVRAVLAPIGLTPDPPGGKVGEVVADAISNPEREMREDLENFARQVERGELNLGGPGAQAR